MSIQSIEARALVLMGQHKEQLARRVAEYEDANAPYSAFAEPNLMEQGTDLEIIDVPPAPTAPEVLDPETQEPIPSTEAATIEGADAADPEHPLAALHAAEDHIEATKDAE